MKSVNRVAKRHYYLSTTCHALALMFLVMAGFTGCTEVLSPDNNQGNNQASWNESKQILIVSGQTGGAIQKVTVNNAKTNAIIGEQTVLQDGSWELKLSRPAVVPCVVAISTSEKNISVKNTSTSCDTLQRQSLTVSRANATIQSVTPEGTIVSPASDLIIEKGGIVNFAALGSETQLKYHWLIKNESRVPAVGMETKVQNPGDLQFNKPGKYRVVLRVTNELGIEDPTPDERIINVRLAANANRINVLSPVASIDSPVGDQTINVGDMLDFAGSATDPANTSSMIFNWDFGGASATSTVQNPGQVTFNQVGTFVVDLLSIDGAGTLSLNTSQVIITVQETVGANQAPTGIIAVPVTDLTVLVGNSVDFVGAAIDPDGDSVSYAWDFGGLPVDTANPLPPADVPNPGAITFNAIGSFPILLAVADAAGLTDPNPPSRLITVVGATPAASDPVATMIAPETPTMSINTGDSVTFEGTATSPSGNDPVTVEWNRDDGVGTVDVIGTDLLLPPVLFDVAGTFTITFIATDSAGAVSVAPPSVIIEVTDPASPPPVGSLLSVIDEPETGDVFLVDAPVALVAEAEGGVPPYTFEWDTGDPDVNAEIDDLTLSEIQAVYPMAGEYTIMLTVTDADEAAATSTVTIMIETTTATPAPVDPTPPATPGAFEVMITSPMPDMATFVEGDTVEFAGTAAEGVPPYSYLWSTGDPNADATVENLAMPDIEATYMMTGEYTATLTVTDADDTSVTAEVLVTIEPAVAPPPPSTNPAPEPIAPSTDAPTGVIEAPIGDVEIVVGEAVEFIGSGTDPDDLPLSYLWDFGGAAPPSTAQSPGMITFDTVGTFVVILTVTNDEDLVDPTPPSVTVVVLDAADDDD